MGFFNKKNTVPQSLPSNGNIKVAENLYKQNLELAIRNKTLSLLRELYQISILSLEINSLAFKITKTIREALEYEFVGIYLYSEEKKSLDPLKFSLSERLTALEISTSHFIEDQSLPQALNIPFFKDAVDNRVHHTNDIKSVWGDIFPSDTLEKYASECHIKTVFTHPLLIDGKVTGMIMFGLNKEHDSLSQYERESIASLVDVVAVALDRARIYEELAVANKGQETLLHVINHQIKGKLSNGKNVFAELLHTDDYGKVPDEAKALLARGLTEMESAINYVLGILKGTSAAKGTLPYNMKNVDLRPIVENLVAQQKPAAESKGFTFSADITTDSPLTILGDDVQLTEALRNLIENAMRYNRPNGSIKVSLATKGGSYIVSVKDSGDGVDEDVKSKLFKPGSTSKKSLSKNPESSGFGLAFVKGVLDAHKGTVGYRPNDGERGSTFFVTLPALTSK